MKDNVAYTYIEQKLSIWHSIDKIWWKDNPLRKSICSLVDKMESHVLQW